ncbi:MAG: hypothetical protein QNK19_17440 [Xanthomonadales bacterium]|nr:hypothetical protein [Xanthomonadales bacterium]
MVIDFAGAAREAAAKVANSPSALVQQEVSRIKRILQPEASRDVTGPAATITRRIDGRLREALAVIRRLEGQLKVGTNQTQTATQLRETIDQLLYHIAMDWLELRLQMNQPAGALEGLQRRLPQWFRKLIDLAQRRKGLPMAGGALRPFNLKNTTGNRRDPHFKGEVVPHHALPEKQRKGLRPDGLEWLYNF